MLEERLHHPDADNGFILDGYPRNLAQANALDGLLARLEQPMDVAVQIDVSPELLVERIAGRAKIEARADDSPAAVRHRRHLYAQPTAPVGEYSREPRPLASGQG